MNGQESPVAMSKSELACTCAAFILHDDGRFNIGDQVFNTALFQ